jgi:oligosaccharide:H+ symporter
MKKNSFFIRAFFFFYYVAWTFMFSFIPVYLRNRGFSIGEIGSLTGISALVGALIQLSVGHLSDRLRRRKPFIILGLLLGAFIYLFVFPNVRNYRDFILLYSIIGLCIYTILTIASVLVIDLSLSGQVGRDYASTRMWGSIGFLVCILTTGIFPILTDPKYMFLIIGIAFIVSTIFVFLIEEPNIKTSVLTPQIKNIKRLIGDSNILKVLLFYFFYYTALTAASSNVNLLVKSLGGTNRMISFSYAASSGVEIPFMLIMGILSDRIGRRPLLFIASLALPIRMLLYSLARSPLAIIGIQTMHSVTFAIIAVIPIVYINDLVSKEERGTAQGMLNMTTAFSSAFGPFLAGYIADRVGISKMFLFLMLIALFATIIVVIFLEESKQDVASSNKIFVRPLYRKNK